MEVANATRSFGIIDIAISGGLHLHLINYEIEQEGWYVDSLFFSAGAA